MEKVCGCGCCCGSPLMRTDLFVLIQFECTTFVCTCSWEYIQGSEYMYYVPLFVVHTFTIGVARRGSLQWSRACVVLVLKLQIVSRIILLDSVLGAFFVWVNPCHIEMK